MIRRGLPIRICALVAAYALVLHALLASIAPAAHLPSNALSTNAVICTGTPGAGQPAGQDQRDHATCVLHCLFAGCAMDGSTPVVSDIFAVFAPADSRVAMLQPAETLGRATTKNPQIPRAPPLA